MAGAPFQLFPALDAATEAALRASIQRFGILVPVLVSQDGDVLDGHHRKRIADELGVECPVQRVWVESDDDARDIALTVNADRRQLTPEQRREIVKALREDGHSLRAIGDALGVSDGTVRNDLEQLRRTTQLAEPDRIVGRDGKDRPSRREIADTVQDATLGLEPGEAEAIADELYDGLDEVTDDDIAQALEENVGSKELPPARPPVTKPDLGGGVSHPARYTDALLPVFADWLEQEGAATVLDPFAGTGRIHELREIVPGLHTVGVELEPEWANLHPATLVGNALALPFEDESFDAICTSPTYGNRLADSHNASDPHLRRSYTHDLGRKLSDANSGAMQWGGEYRCFHEDAWAEAVRVLSPGGLFLLNIKDHIRNGVVQPVSAWHLDTLVRGHDMQVVHVEVVGVPSLRQGANAEARIGHEFVFVLRKPAN